MLMGRPGSGSPFYAPARDVAHLFPLIFRETAVLLQETLKDDPPAIQALDELTRDFIEMYTLCMEDRAEGILRYNRILDKAADCQVYSRVLARHSQVLQFMLFVTMFSSRSFPQECTPLTSETLGTSSALAVMLLNASVEDRRAALSRWKEDGLIPENLDTGYLRRPVLVKVAAINKQEAAHAPESP